MRIYIYGTGRYASNFCNYSNELDGVVGFIETKKSKNQFRGKPVYTPLEVQEYDLILVASQFVYEIKETLYRCGFDLEKVVFLAKSWIPTCILKGNLQYCFEKACKESVDSSVFFELSSIYTTSEKIARKFEGERNHDSFWQECSNYQTDVHAPHISSEQRGMLDDSFIPKLSKNDNICDIGCASGEWSRFISPHVATIEGFDISEPMINTAKTLSEEYGFRNTSFTCINALDLEYDKVYDNAMVLGVGIYLQKNSLDMMVKNIANSIKKGGYVAVRDTMSMYIAQTVYIVRLESGNFFEKYVATYIPMKEYEKIYLNNGFKIVEHRYFCSYFHEPLELGAHGYIFEKV